MKNFYIEKKGEEHEKRIIINKIKEQSERIG